MPNLLPVPNTQNNSRQTQEITNYPLRVIINHKQPKNKRVTKIYKQIINCND
ncbi:hypothetical protein ACE6H2_003374 [Prunus campanulata]